MTVVTNFVGIGLPEKEQLARKMQKSCGTGGTVKDGQIEIQGDQREAVARILTEAGFRPVFAGGGTQERGQCRSRRKEANPSCPSNTRRLLTPAPTVGHCSMSALKYSSYRARRKNRFEGSIGRVRSH